MDTVKRLSEHPLAEAGGVRLIGIPKTIDNDIEGTDHTPGYGSAAKFVASAVQEIIRDASVYSARSFTAVEVMGREAGWLTCASALPRLTGGSAPDLVYPPELGFDPGRFAADVGEVFKYKNTVVAAVGEGIRYAGGEPVGLTSATHTADGFSHHYYNGTSERLCKIIEEAFACKTRAVTLNTLQRCASHLASLRDLTDASEIGRAAVRAAISGESGVMMAFRRGGGIEYSSEIVSAPLSGAANRTRRVPREYFNEAGNNVTGECLQYILPLVQGEAEIFYKDGIPLHFKPFY